MLTPEQQAARAIVLEGITDPDIITLSDLGCPFCHADPYTDCPHFTATGEESSGLG